MKTRLADIVVVIAIMAMFVTAEGAVVFTETFDDLSGWTIVDADGAGSANVVEAVGGKLHVVNSSNTILAAGLYQQVAPLTARVYFWGVVAETAQPIGAFNLSTSSGLHFFTDTPVGVYLPERVGPQTKPQLIANNDNGSAEGAMTAGLSYDFRLEYNANPNVGLFYKLSSQTQESDWTQIGVHVAYTPSGSPYYLNLLGSGLAVSGTGAESNWTLDQIDITDRDDDVLVAPVPEPSAAFSAIAGAAVLIRRRRS